MNIFVTSPCPKESAICLPDKHIVKMPLECCQMLAIVASEKWGHGYGTIPKSDGTPYKTEKGAFRNHPCTKWASESIHNTNWLIEHGIQLCHEYTYRFGKFHSCFDSLIHAMDTIPHADYNQFTPFARAMPDEFKYDDTIDTYTAYKRYIASKPWVSDNYIRMPDRKPSWVD